MKILCVLGRHNYGDPNRGAAYEYSNFLPALERLGHEVVVFESFARGPYRSFHELNQKLLSTVEATSPDVVFTVLMQYEVWIETLQLIRCAGTRLINWSTDDSWKYKMFSRYIAREFDLYISTYPSALPWYAQDGIETVFLSQWGANAATLEPPLSLNECDFPVSFVGSAYGNRADIVQRLKAKGINVDCYGHGWPAGPVEANRIAQIVRKSGVTLNFSEGSQGQGIHKHQVKARVFEVPGYGGCLLTQTTPYLEQYYALEKEVATFSTEDELFARLRRLLDHPAERDEMARLGHERVISEHTYDGRFAAILQELDRRVPPRPRKNVDWEQFRMATRRHSTGLLIRTLRNLLCIPCNLAWGPKRGPRAARRIAFELSWRFLGARTYSAAGLPGRMFYKES